MIKAVVDTNIFISGLICGGLPQRLIDAWEEGRFCLVTSNPLIEELISVIDEPRFEKIINESAGAHLIALIRRNAIIVHPTHTVHVCRDSKDNMVIETAITAKADMIVSGDRDLLELNKYRSVKILSPKEFLNLLHKK